MEQGSEPRIILAGGLPPPDFEPFQHDLTAVEELTAELRLLREVIQAYLERHA